MKKGAKYYLIVWAVVLILFNLIAFIGVGQGGFTPSFWLGYSLIALSFIGQLVCSWFAFKENNPKKKFYHLSLITTSYIGLILCLVFGGLCMVSPLPYWVSIILCALVLAFNIIAAANAADAAELVSDIDDRIRTQTFFIKSMTIDAERLVSTATSPAIKMECQKVRDAVRYSDPMSNPMLDAVEAEITAHFNQLSNAVATQDQQAVSSAAREILISLDHRNQKCKLLK